VASQAAPLRQTYRVQPGDTLSAIAARFGTTVAALLALNHIPKPHLVKVGQTLVVRGAAVRPPARPRSKPVAQKRYRVRHGDTLTAIAARFDTTVDLLSTSNGLRPPYVIKTGQVLVVTEAVEERAYRVQPGDTLFAIAERFDTTVAELATTNELRHPYVLHPGQLLTLPPPSPQAAVQEAVHSA